MATYAQYTAAISGKTFPSNYFYTVSISTENQNGLSGTYVYSGTASSFFGSGISGTVSDVDSTVGSFSIGGTKYFIHGSTADGANLIISQVQSGGAQGQTSNGLFVLANSGTIPTGPLSFSTTNPYSAPSPTCFATGTMILTARGEVAVEHLSVGDLVITADGRALPIRWIGHRFTPCAASPWKADVSPIRIERDAIGSAVPSRPLTISPGHCLELDDGWLIQAGHLVNGRTIRQVEVDSVTYWHVELDEHAILVANGARAESYLDVGNRAEFDNAERTATVMHPRFVAEQLDLYCLPVIQDQQVRDYYRASLDERADALGRDELTRAA